MILDIRVSFYGVLCHRVRLNTFRSRRKVVDNKDPGVGLGSLESKELVVTLVIVVEEVSQENFKFTSYTF